MGIDLEDFEARTSHAVRVCWDTHAAAAERQKLNGVLDQGERAGVTSDKNMDGFVTLITNLLIAVSTRQGGLRGEDGRISKATSFKRSSLLSRHISQQRLRCSGRVAMLANLTDDCARNG